MFRRGPERVTRACLSAGAVFVLLSTGCSKQSAPPAAETERRTVTASASELFIGDLKRIEPHLGFTSSGCVRLDFGPPDRFITLEAEVWQNGKRLPTGRSSHRWAKGPVDASISITPTAGAGGKRRIRITTALTGQGLGATGTEEHDEPAIEGRGSHATQKKLTEPVELAENRPVAVWAYLVYKMGGPFPPESARTGSFEEAAKEAQWAVVFKVGWEEPKP